MLEGLVMGESVGCLVEEIADYQEKTLFCDNTAAVALATSKGGSWRTRHLKVRAAHLRYKTETEEWKVRHLAGLDMVADIGTKALRGDRIAYLNELMKVMPAPRTAEVSAQALVDSEEAEQRHTNYLRAVTAVPTTYQQDLEKVAKLVALIELFQKIQTVAAGNDSVLNESETEGGESFLAMLSAVMIVVGMILVKVLENAVHRPRARVARMLVEEPTREEPVVVDDFDENIVAAGLRVRRQRGGVGGPDGEVRGDRLPPAGGGLAAARGRPGGVAAAVMTEQELFAAADTMSGIAEESSESSRPEEPLDELRRSAVPSEEQATAFPEQDIPLRWTEISDEQMQRPEIDPLEQRLLENLLGDQVPTQPQQERQPRRWRDMTTEEIVDAAMRGDLSISEEGIETPAWGLSESDGDPDGDEGAAPSGADGGAPGGGDAAALGEGLPAGGDRLRGLGRGPIITPYGDRFHKRESCPALARSLPVERRILCRDCGVRYPGVTVVFLEFNGVVHTDPQCTNIESHADIRCLTSCMRCFAP